MSSRTQKIRARRVRLFRAQDKLCFWCGFVMNMRGGNPANPAACTLEHVKPKSRGHHEVAGNSVAACWRCNQLKDDLPADVFLARYALVIALPPRPALQIMAPELAPTNVIQNHQPATHTIGDKYPTLGISCGRSK